MVSLASTVEMTEGKFVSLLSAHDQSKTCKSSNQEGSAFTRAQVSTQHRAATSTDGELIPFDNAVEFPVKEISDVYASPIAFGITRHADTPVTSQVSSSKSATPCTDSHSDENKSWLQEQREKQQARYLRYVPNWWYVTQRSLPPREIPGCHASAKDWPALGYSQSRTEELEVCKDLSASNSRIRAKPRFRNFYASSSLPRQDLKQVQVNKNNAHEKCKKVSMDDGVKGASCEPKLLMLNKDFIVTSPVLENLLVTIALTSQKRGEEQEDLAVEESAHLPNQILIGRFTAFSSYLRMKLCRDALRVKFEQNAGGTSTISEALSVEYFARRFQAQDVVTEMEVEYWSSNWKKVDYICTLYGQRVGVSVTRAMAYPDPNSFSTEIAYRLLHKKLYGLVVARDGVSKRHSFCKCLLHVWCETQRTAEIMKDMYAVVKKELEISDDVIMVFTVADGVYARPSSTSTASSDTD